MRSRFVILHASVAVALLAASASSVGAQLSDVRLDAKHDQAIAVAFDGTPDGFDRAVVLHSQVVHERQPHDARRFDCLRSHANLLYYAGHSAAARLYLEAAAEQAQRQGLDYEAAMTFVDAAILAREARDRTSAIRLAEHASTLSTSPRVSRDQRQEIQERIGG